MIATLRAFARRRRDGQQEVRDVRSSSDYSAPASGRIQSRDRPIAGGRPGDGGIGAADCNRARLARSRPTMPPSPRVWARRGVRLRACRASTPSGRSLLDWHAQGVRATSIHQAVCKHGFTGSVHALYRFLGREGHTPEATVILDFPVAEVAQVDFPRSPTGAAASH